jgi:hypothetical protein
MCIKDIAIFVHGLVLTWKGGLLLRGLLPGFGVQYDGEVLLTWERGQV